MRQIFYQQAHNKRVHSKRRIRQLSAKLHRAATPTIALAFVIASITPSMITAAAQENFNDLLTKKHNVISHSISVGTESEVSAQLVGSTDVTPQRRKNTPVLVRFELTLENASGNPIATEAAANAGDTVDLLAEVGPGQYTLVVGSLDNINKKEEAHYALSVDLTSTGGGGGGGSSSEIVACSDPTVHSVNPSNFMSVASSASNGCHVFNMAPGNYSQNEEDVPTLGDVTIRCTQRHECVVNEWHIAYYGTLIIEGMKFSAFDNKSTTNYGLALYYGDAVRLQDNVWDTASSNNQTHGVSIKNTVDRAEVLDNTFDCLRHCIEISQNGNIRTRNSLTGNMIIRGNTFSSINSVITNRNSCDVIIDNNVFNSSPTVIANVPYWDLYPYGDSGDNGELYVPKCPYPQDQATGTIGPISTQITNNVFNGGEMYFEGRGIVDDTVYLSGNSGSFTCSLDSMGSGAISATIDEQTAGPPQLGLGSDPC